MVKSKLKKETSKSTSTLPISTSPKCVIIGEVDLFQLLSPLLSLSIPESKSPSVLVLTPQREKILSLKSWLKQNSSLSICALTPGTGTNTELANLQKSYQVLIASPDRFFYHLSSGTSLSLSSLTHYFIDSCDSVLTTSHRSALETLLKAASTDSSIKIQASRSSEALQKFCEEFPSFVIINKQSELAEIEAVQQYVLIDTDKKFLLLHTLLFKNQLKKTVVVFNTSNEVSFFSQMLKELGIKNLSVHSLKTAEKNKTNLERFTAAGFGILLSTCESLVGVKNAAKDFLIVFDMNEDLRLLSCVQRVSCAEGKVILFVVEQEQRILSGMFPKAINMKVSANQIFNVQEKIEKIVKRNYEMHKKAREGYKNYILSTKNNEYHKVAKNFGLEKAFLVNNLSH